MRQSTLSLTIGQQYSGSQAGQLETSTDRGLIVDDNDQEDINIAPSLPGISTSSLSVAGQQDTSFCGSGRIGSISSASSLGRSSPPVVLQLLWLCLIFMIFLPANALCSTFAFWYPTRFLQFIGFSLAFSGALNSKGVLDDLCTVFDLQSIGIYRRAVERYLLFILGMPKRTIIKCHCRGWWWWRSWKRCSSRHFRWKFCLKTEYHFQTRFRVRSRIFDKKTIVLENYWMTLTNRPQRFPISSYRFTTLRFRLTIIIYSRISKGITKSRQMKKRWTNIGDHAGEIRW